MICNPRCLLRSLCLLEAFPISCTIAPGGNDFVQMRKKTNSCVISIAISKKIETPKQLYPCFCEQILNDKFN